MDAKTKAAEIKNTGLARILVAYLVEKLQDTTNALIITKDNDSLRQLQGRAQELNDLIKFFTGEK
jgi:hypothetical protein